MTNPGKPDPLLDGFYGFSAPERRPQARSWERFDVPAPEARTYGHAAPRGSVPPRRRKRMGVVLGGVLTALAAGAVFGFLGRPNLGEGALDAPPAPPPPDLPAETQAAPPAPGQDALKMDEITRLALGEPKAGEARPAAQAPKLVVRAHAPAPRKAEVVPPPPAPKVERTVVRPAPAPRAVEQVNTWTPAPPPARRLVSPCDGLRPAEQMVCSDPRLAALDRRLDLALNAAVRSGAPAYMLREDQDEWAVVREHAARRSRGDLEDAYRVRIAEVEELLGAP